MRFFTLVHDQHSPVGWGRWGREGSVPTAKLSAPVRLDGHPKEHILGSDAEGSILVKVSVGDSLVFPALLAVGCAFLFSLIPASCKLFCTLLQKRIKMPKEEGFSFLYVLTKLFRKLGSCFITSLI